MFAEILGRGEGKRGTLELKDPGFRASASFSLRVLCSIVPVVVE